MMLLAYLANGIATRRRRWILGAKRAVL